MGALIPSLGNRAQVFVIITLENECIFLCTLLGIDYILQLTN